MTEAATIDNVIPRADIVKRAARVGAEIRNIKLSGDLSDQTIGAINKMMEERMYGLTLTGLDAAMRRLMR